MSARLDGREVVLIVAGGISAYKSVIVARELIRLGARVETVLTAAAQKFVGGVTFAGITGRPARIDLWDPNFPGELHIELTRRADLIVVAPATADLIARAAHGQANDLASTVLLSAKGPIVMAPAMHPRMWEHAATVSNVTTLRTRGVMFVGPEDGPLASGENGIGRMTEPDAIAAFASSVFKQDMDGVRVLITAGPTHEALDPVRFVGNRSSGKMGVALASRALSRGAVVTLVHGPMSTQTPPGVQTVSVRSAIEMHQAVVSRVAVQDLVIMAAAVADYRPAEIATEKVKKGNDEWIVRLVKNPDILSDVGHARGTSNKPVLVGFAVETSDLVKHAREKLERKACDLVVANLAQDGFEGDDNTVTLVTREAARELGRQTKVRVADEILDAARGLLDLSLTKHDA